MFILLTRVPRENASRLEQGVAERKEKGESQKQKPPWYARRLMMPPVSPVPWRGRLRGRFCNGRGLAGCVAAGWSKPVRYLNAWLAGVAQVVNQPGGFRSFDATRSQGGQDFCIGVTRVHHASGEFHVRGQNVVYHI